MAKNLVRRFISDESGAVASTYALSLVAVIGLAGVGYDFAQVAALDTELQNAADQAALAAATQLDGSASAITNATAAASNLAANSTLMAGDDVGAAITIKGTAYFATRAAAEADTPATTDPAKARFVRVTINSRHARYALTPIVGLVTSPQITAAATAGMGSSLCKVPPLMMCNPAEDTDPDFTTDYIGKGILLVSVGGGAWAPGNFGYLDVNGGDSGNPLLALKKALGWDVPPGDCLPESGLNTKPGANTPVTHALNTRFDIYENGGPGGDSCPSGGNCPPSLNVVKDLIRDDNANSCGIGSKGWHLPTTEYLPEADGSVKTMPEAMGHPRDLCHAKAAQTCKTGDGKIGDGDWQRDLYFSVNYPGFNWRSAMNLAYGTNDVTRYQVYRWELAHRADTYLNTTTGTTMTIGGARVAEAAGKTGHGNNSLDYNQPICTPPGTSPVDPLTAGTDRRTFPVAVANCKASGVNGSSTNVPVIKWLNVFIVEPSLNRTRTQQQELYVEVVSVQDMSNSDGGQANLIRRDKAYLVR